MTIAQPLPAPYRAEKKFAESLFLLSPLIVMLFSIFNIVDTKWILSRLIPVVCLYCMVYYRNSGRKNWDNPTLKPLLVTSFAALIYFTFMHITRGDEFGFSRTLLTCLIYILLVPWNRIGAASLRYLLLGAAIFCGINAGYEYFAMSIQRVGIATNPIPYALFCATLFLISLYYLLSEKSLVTKSVAGVGVMFTLTALVLTDVRGVLLFVPVVALYLIVRMLPASKRYYGLALVIVSALAAVGYMAFQEKIDNRIQVTVNEFKAISEGNKKTSIGVRLDLWKTAADVIESTPLFGASDEALQATIVALPNPNAAKVPHLHNQYLDTLARSGLVGFGLLMMWILSPLMRSNPLRLSNNALTPLTTSIVLMVLLASLTDVPFHHTHLVYLYTLLMTLLLVIGHSTEQEKTDKGAFPG